ncbi:hypothetical protein [Providencia alcalifaciens]|uniref:hypothetical protein n=1 Tax=Providencia alcalifaciens TaxID=126385 RepID=UPI00029C6242|nr:hypothetical protein [Providencia alcalifaciens]EKT66947.1 hypothetical protein OO9_03808 [Providencia alcalifaciens Dmel2]
MLTIPLMTLPVYRLSRDMYYKQRESYVEKSILKSPYVQNNEIILQQESLSNHLKKCFGGCWEYNEIIGFIELHFCGTQIRGKYWRDDKKRHVKTRRKQFIYNTHKLAYETNIHRNATSQEIELLIEQYIEKCREELNCRYIDDSAFTNLKGFVDWNSLLHSACN